MSEWYIVRGNGIGDRAIYLGPDKFRAWNVFMQHSALRSAQGLGTLFMVWDPSGVGTWRDYMVTA